MLATPPTGLHVTGFRDPCPWKDGDAWYMVVGSGLNQVGGAVLLYRSPDAQHWTYLHPLAQGKWREGTTGNPVDTGEMWECPDFFPLGEKHVLLYSTERKVYWEVGTFDKQELRFHSETRGLLDHGSYYAMKSMVDSQGRRILWGWVQETRTPAECTAACWAGAMALPRVLSLSADHRLRMEVPTEFHSLLRPLAAGGWVKQRSAMIDCQFEAGKPCSFVVRAGTATLFAVRHEGGASIEVASKTVQLSPGADGSSRLQVWFDGSIIEAFIDSQEAVTARCYGPSLGGIQVVQTGVFKVFSVAQVAAISKDRLTS